MMDVVNECGAPKECKITLNNNYPFNQYISDGETKDYLFNFLLLNHKDLSVYATPPDVQASSCDKLVLDTDYIIKNYGKDGGTIELSKAYASGYIITITLDSNYNIDTNFKEGRTFSGAELDLIFNQISLYFKELSLLFLTTLKYPINSIIDPTSTYIPQLKDGNVWVGKNNKIIQVPLPSGGGGGDCCEILKAELANNNMGVDGARMIGLYNKIDNLHTNLSVAINDLYEKVNNSTTIPKPKEDELYLYMSNDKNGDIFWDKSIIGSVYKYLHKVYEETHPGLLYLDGDGYYPFTKSEAGIPYSRLADAWWDEANGEYEFGGSGEAYTAEVLPELNNGVLLLVNDIRIKNNVVFENLDLSSAIEYAPSTMSCAQLINRDALEVYERDVSSGGFSDKGTGVTFYGHQYIDGLKGNSGIIDFQNLRQTMVGGEYFTFLGVRVYYVVAGKGNPPSSSGIRRLVRVNIRSNYAKTDVMFLTKHALRGTGVYLLDPDFRENAMFSLTSPDLKVYLKYGDQPNEYDLGVITLYIPEDKSMEERAQLIKKGINKYSFAVPDARDLHLRCGDDEHLDPTVGWRNVEARKKFRLQYGGIVISDTLKPHNHVYGLTSTLAQGPEIGTLYPDTTTPRKIYQVNQSTTPTGNVETRGSAMIAYFYVRY